MSVALADRHGRFLTFADLQATTDPGLVLVAAFLSVRDSASRAVAPEIAGLYARYAARGVECAAVFPNEGETAEMVRRFLAETGLAGTALLDRGAAAGRVLGLPGTPSFCIIDRTGILRYRGVFRREGDAAAEGGAAPGGVEAALEAMLAGKAVEVPDAPGSCTPFRLPTERGPGKPPAAK
jgi:hypothetical protein